MHHHTSSLKSNVDFCLLQQALQNEGPKKPCPTRQQDFVTFSSIFVPEEGRLGVVSTFLAMLELLKDNLIEFVQTTPFGPIHLKGIESGE